MVQIIYLISIIYLTIMIFLYKKKEEKINLVSFLITYIVLLMCYNIVICLIFDTFKIDITLLYLSIPNMLLSIIMTYLVIKKKEIQKYHINSTSVLFLIVIFLTAVVFGLINFTKDLNINYVTTDSAVHFMGTKSFFKDNCLNGKMIGAYVNSGILLKIVAPLTEEFNLYKYFILFDIFLYFLTGASLYIAIEKVLKEKFYGINLLMVILFMIGYPLNILIYGYVYLQLAIIIIATTMALLQKYSEEKSNRKLICLGLLLTNFGVFFSYCLLAPIIYLVELIYLILIVKKEQKKIINKDILLICTVIFIIPCLSGLLSFVAPYITSTGVMSSSSELAATEEPFWRQEGYIYRNLWSNFIPILLIIFPIFKIKKDDSLLVKIFLFVQIPIMIVSFLIIGKYKLSTYYYYKLNFLLWFVLWYGAIYTVNLIEHKMIGKIITTYIILYTIILFVFLKYSSVEITKEAFDSDENITNAFDIYGINKTIILYSKPIYNKEDLEAVIFIRDNLEIDNNNTILMLEPRQELWFQVLLDYKGRTKKEIDNAIPANTIEKWNNKEEYKYMFILKNNAYYNVYKKYVNPAEIIFENESGLIYKNY